MTYALKIRYNSVSQQNVCHQIMSGGKRTILVRGGSGSGKTHISMIAIAKRALKYANTEHYLLKTDLKVLKAAFDRSVIKWLEDSGIPASKSRKNNTTYFYDQVNNELHFANGSTIYLRPIRSPKPYGSRGDAALLGLNAETIYLDESTTIGFEWYEFLETRARSAHGCPPLIILTENPDARAWTSMYFDQQINPKTMEPLTPQQIAASIVMRLEAWENVLQDRQYLDILKHSGNALRFYYGQIDTSPDYGQIYQYRTDLMPMRMYNIYALDPGYQARTGIVQIGFGGDYSVNVRELCYAQGFGHDDFMRECQKIIDKHADYLAQIEMRLKPGQEQFLSPIQVLPHLIVDCARVDLINDIDRRFNYETINGVKLRKPKIIVIPCRKGEAKYYSIERVKKLAIAIDPLSKFMINEINKYRYDVTKTDDEKVPDGEDDLLDAMLYGLRYVLEDIFESQPRALTFDLTRKQIYEQIKHLAA